jgi:type IV pilus assembly protein PilE
MNTLRIKRILGFTIMELMIVLAIIAILVALAYPSYTQYARKAKRGDAQQLLMNWSINMEIWRSNNPSYANGSDPGAPAPSNDNYNFAASGMSATGYTLSATAKSGNDQENDVAKDGTSCTPLNLNSNGQKYSGGDTAVTICWE